MINWFWKKKVVDSQLSELERLLLKSWESEPSQWALRGISMARGNAIRADHYTRGVSVVSWGGNAGPVAEYNDLVFGPAFGGAWHQKVTQKYDEQKKEAARASAKLIETRYQEALKDLK